MRVHIHICVCSYQVHVYVLVCSVVVWMAPEHYETARWNECVLSKPCRSKLILVSDVNLRIELLYGGAMLTPDGVEVKAVCVRVRDAPLALSKCHRRANFWGAGP